jgi:RND superfamily putative drug exporter
MSAIARWCYRHRFVVIAAWVVVLFGLGALSQAVKSDYNNSFSLPGTGSTAAQQLLARAVPAQAGDSDTIVWQVDHGTVRDPAVAARMTAMLRQVATMPEVAAVVGPYGPRGAAQVSRDGRTAYATVDFARQANALAKADVTRVIDAAKAVRAPGLDVQLGGQAIETTEQAPLSTSSTVGVLAAAVVLFIAFGSLLAMLLPLVTAIAGVGGGLMAITPLTHAMNVVDFAPILGALIGLGVGIDYALFIVTRHRRGLQAGLTPEEAAVKAIDTSGRAVLFAGSTSVHRAARHPGPGRRLPERSRGRLRADRRVHRARGGHPAARAARCVRDARAEPTAAAPAGRRGSRPRFRGAVGALVGDSRTQARGLCRHGRGGHGGARHPGAQPSARLLGPGQRPVGDHHPARV